MKLIDLLHNSSIFHLVSAGKMGRQNRVKAIDYGIIGNINIDAANTITN